MDDNRIEIVASLDIPKTKTTIKDELGGEVKKYLDDNKALKIICHIDENSVNNLQAELNGISKKLKLNVPEQAVKVDVQSNNSATDKVAKNLENANNKALTLKKTLSDLSDKYTKPFKAVFDNEGYLNAERTLSKIQSRLSKLGEVTVVGKYSDNNSPDSLEKITATIKATSGEVRTLNFLLDNTDDKFKLLDSSYSDKGVSKVQKDITRLGKELSSFEASHKSIESGLTEPLRLANNALIDLESGVGSVEAVEKALDNLKKAAAEIEVYLKPTGASFNIDDNAVNKAKNYGNVIKSLSMDVKALGDSNGKISLISSLDKASVKLKELQQIESQSGKGLEWAKTYNEVSSLIQTITNDLKVAQKEETAFANDVGKRQAEALKEISSAYKEIYQANNILNSDKSTDTQREIAQQHLEVQNEIINSKVEQLNQEGLLSSELQKEIQEYERINQEQNAIAESIRIRKQEEQKTESQSELQKKNLKEIQAAYSAISKELKTFYASGSTDTQREYAAEHVNEQLKTIDNLKEQLSLEGLLTDEIQQQIEAYAKEAAEQDEILLSIRDKYNVSMGFNVQKAINALDDWANKNKKVAQSSKLVADGSMTVGQKLQELQNRLRSGDLSPEAFKHLNEEIAAFKKYCDATGLTVNSFFRNMRMQLSQVLMQWVSLQGAIRIVRELTTEVTSLDTAMINMRRVTSGTSEDYDEFLDKANEKARELKTTTSSLIEQSYQWAKLGYDMKDALELSEASTIFSKVADVGQDQALNNLVTTLKAFNIEAKDTIQIVDMLDKLNNEYAVSASGLGQALERSASAMSMTGNSLEQTLALITGAGEITQNLENTGNAMRIIGLRLQGMKGKLEELGEPVDDLMEVSKVQTQILNLTKNQVNIFDESTQSFRSTYDILKDVSKIWNTLSATNRANLTEIMFGKNRANVGLAIIQAFQSGQIEAAYEDATNAAGTATKEYEEMMEGIEAHFSALKGQFQELANTIISSDLVNNTVQGATEILKVLTLITDKLGVLPTLISAIYTTRYVKYGKGKLKPNMPTYALL